MPKQNLENEKWIEIRFSLMGVSSLLVRLKDDFKKYAEELEWEVETDKKGVVDENGNRLYRVAIIPKGKKASSEEIREKRDLIVGFAQSIYYDVHYKGVHKDEIPPMQINFSVYQNEKKEWIYGIHYGDVLLIEAPLKKIIKFEKENHNLSKSAFVEQSPYEWYKDEVAIFEKRFASQEDRDRAERVMKIME